MELDGPLWWVFFIVGIVFTGFLLTFMMTVLRAAQEALIFFRRANEEHQPDPVAPPSDPAATFWDDVR